MTTQPQLPDTLEEATSQAIASLDQALNKGISRLLIDLRFQELKPLPVAYEIAMYLKQRYGIQWQALFADAGMAALAKRDWADPDISLRGVNEGRRAVRPEDQALFLVAPSSVEVEQLERLLALANDRPFIMFNPRLENAEVGIGLYARRLRERFINTFTVVYYLEPLEQGALYQAYPHQWQVWQNPQIPETQMKLIYEGDRPSLETIDQLFRQRTGKGTSFLTRLQNFLSALRS
ncbi:MAG: DUF1995 family protein [Pseudanabaenaceae cyanobacterium]